MSSFPVFERIWLFIPKDYHKLNINYSEEYLLQFSLILYLWHSERRKCYVKKSISLDKTSFWQRFGRKDDIFIERRYSVQVFTTFPACCVASLLSVLLNIDNKVTNYCWQKSRHDMPHAAQGLRYIPIGVINNNTMALWRTLFLCHPNFRNRTKTEVLADEEMTSQKQ